MRTTDRPPSRYDVARSRRSRRAGRRKVFLTAAAAAAVVLLLLATQILYVPPEARTYWVPSAEEAGAAEARLGTAFDIVADHRSPAGPAAPPGEAHVALRPVSHEVRITQADVNIWLASEAYRYADKARNVRMEFGDGIGTVSGIVEFGGRPVHVTATGRLVRSADGTLSAVVDQVYAGRVRLGRVVARRLQEQIDEELQKRGLAGLAVESITVRPGEIIIRERPPSS